MFCLPKTAWPPTCVDLAPFHDFDGKVSADLKAQLDQLKKDIISGAVTVNGVLGIQ